MDLLLSLAQEIPVEDIQGSGNDIPPSPMSGEKEEDEDLLDM